MELKGAEIRNLMELCNPMPKNGTENRKLNVLIPYYQRPYKWEWQSESISFVRI